MSYTFALTLQDIYNNWYAIIKSNENSTAYSRDTFILNKINEAQNKIVNWGLRNPITGEILQMINLPFTNWVQFYSSVQNDNLTADAVVWWTTLTITDTTNFATAWKLWIDWDITTYTGKTATQFTWVTWIWFAHLSWVTVRQLFSLPSDFWLLNRAFFKNKYLLVPVDQRDLINTVSVNTYNYNPFYLDNTTNINQNEYYYSIIDWIYFLPLTTNETAMQIKLEYDKRPTQLVAASPTTQTLAIPDDYALQTIPYIAFWAALIERGEADEWMKLTAAWFENVKVMNAFYNQQRQEGMFWARVRTSSDIKLNI